ncbi:hypothetical protein AB0N24_18110 [Arthrobacter sp. NPDC093128]|uniref:hypothetical protein n=1 Tax=Arthrobacter sp. NPDC093128 TaxID=3154979 RepID=UPI003441C236
MENDSGFYAPLMYSAWLTWAGLGLLFLVAAWVAFVVLSTRQRSGTVPAPPSGPPSDPSGLKRDYLRRIDAVAVDAAAGRVSARASHQELSLLIRSFVRDIAGIDAPRMTLAELNRQGIPAAAVAIGSLYPAEFGPEPRDTQPRDSEPRDSVAAAAETAREVVRTWN